MTCLALRHSRGELGPRQERIEVGPLVIEPTAMSVTLRGEPVVLTANEFTLVHALALRPGRVLDREQLLELLHGAADEAFDRSIDVVVSRVRAKLETESQAPDAAEDGPRRGLHARAERTAARRRLVTPHRQRRFPLA